MKKAIAIFLVLALCLSLCACSGEPEVELVNSYMLNDDTVMAEFKNVGRTTITHMEGSFNLFGGSSSSQNAIATADFEWDGTCQKGETVKVTGKVNKSESGLANKVNRIGHWISEIS